MESGLLRLAGQARQRDWIGVLCGGGGRVLSGWSDRPCGRRVWGLVVGILVLAVEIVAAEFDGFAAAEIGGTQLGEGEAGGTAGG